MIETIDIYNETFRMNYDPTHTTALRNAFARDMKKRFNELASMVIKSVDTNDCFGLKKKPLFSYQMTPAMEGAFNYSRSQEKIEAFMIWLKQQVDKGIITVAQYQQVGSAIEGAWTNMYIIDSYKRGVARARYEMTSAGMVIPSIEASGGIEAVMNTLIHMDRVGILFTRTFNELKGVTEAMSNTISQILAQGMIDGDSPRLLARKIASAITGEGLGELGITDKLGRFIPAKRRAEMIARTEIIRSHSEGLLMEFRNWGVFGVSVKSEFITAGDARVCPQCGEYEGKVFTLDEASGIIPMHPNCRCTWLPYIEELQKYKGNGN
jgi:SPP1 gp7 family putative phage head morphogenesis protein